MTLSDKPERLVQSWISIFLSYFMTMDAVDSHAGTAGGPPSSENVIALEQSYLKVSTCSEA